MAATVGTRRFAPWARKIFSHVIAAAALLTAAGLTLPALAAGFHNNIQSAGAAAVSTAGQTAIAEDASTIYYNAAGMTLLDRRPEIVFTAPVVVLSNEFRNAASVAPLGGPALGSGGAKDGVFTLPSLFATMPLSDRVTAGLGLFIPFGQVNEYDNNWVGRYQLRSISMKTLDINPAIAYRLSDTFSVGAGLDIQYAHLKRRAALDFGSLCFILGNPAACPGLGLLPQGADGQVAVDAEDWSVGFNLSLLYHLGDETHVGLSYRSAVRHGFSGNADFDVPAVAAPLTAGGLLFQDTSVDAAVTFPEVVALGISHRLDDRVTLLFDVDWTAWSRLKHTTINFANPAQPAQTLVFNWKDSYRFAIGGIYRFSETTDLRAGISYDQSAVSSTFRSADLPDSDGIMLSAGLMHRFDERISATVSYTYGHHNAAPINLSVPGSGTLTGTFERSSSAVALQVRVQL
jgi:long-chain fatty acid transport protein